MKRNFKEIIFLLLVHNPDPNAMDRDQKTPLYYALLYRDIEIIKRLIILGARLKEDFIDYKKTLIPKNSLIELLFDEALETDTKMKFTLKPKARIRKWPIIMHNALKSY